MNTMMVPKVKVIQNWNNSKIISNLCIAAVIKRVNLIVTENKSKILKTKKRILLNLENSDKSIRKISSCNKNNNKN